MNDIVEYDGEVLRCPECGKKHEINESNIALGEYTFYCEECDEEVTLEVLLVFRYEVSDDVLRARGTA